MFREGGISSYATNHAVNDGVFTVTAPTYSKYDETTNPHFSSYNYVYFGKTPANNTEKYFYQSTNTNHDGEPILFRVLNTTANGSKTNGGSLEPALLLLTEYDIFKEAQPWAPYGQSWKDDSSLRTMLNNANTEGGTLKDCFDAREIAKIMTTYNSENSTISTDNPDNIYWTYPETVAYGCGLEGEKLFLLSAKESVNNTYGFATIEEGANVLSYAGGFADGNRIAKRGDAAGSIIGWWLRSASSDSEGHVAILFPDGSACYTYSYETSVGVHFALNIPLSSIIYTSAATEGSSSSQLAPITPQAKSEAASAKGVEPTAAAKLVLKDSNRDSFQVTEPTVTAAPEGTFTLNYTGAKTNSNSNNEYISLIIKDENGEGLYYETLQENTTADDEDGTVSVTLPDLELGDYTLMILNEQRNPAKETNYAGYDTVALSVRTIPTATHGYRRIDTGVQKGMIIAKDEGADLWKVVATNQDVTNAQALYTFTGEATTQPAIFDLPTTTTTEVYVVDDAGNVSDAIPLTLDTEPPTAVIDNSGQTSKLIVTDNGSGIKRIGEVPYNNYPATVTITPAPLSVEVEDALGNVKLYTTKKAIVTAEDTGTGLWKVVTTPSAEAEPIALFNDNGGTTQTLVFTVFGDLSTVYVVDKAGNVSEGFILITDETAPTGTVSYNEGIITLTVTDNYSGVARIGSTEYSTYPTATSTPISIGTTAMEVEDALGNEDELQLTLDNQAPTGENGYARIDNSGESPVKRAIISVQEVGESGLWKVIVEDENISNNPTLEQIRNATPLTTTFIGEGTAKKALFNITDTTKANVYVVDHAGNLSTAIPLSIDTEAPTAVVNYNTTPITITVTATGAGIARIGDTQYPTYPESQTYELETIPQSGTIEVEDALGNIREIQIDDTAPTVSATERYGRVVGGTVYVTLTATDEGTGLWKVVTAQNWTENDVIYTFTGTEATQTVRFNYSGTGAETLYVVDKAGNVSNSFTLTIDNAAPTVSRGYVRTITE